MATLEDAKADAKRIIATVHIPEQSGPGFRTKLGHPNGAKWATSQLRVEAARG